MGLRKKKKKPYHGENDLGSFKEEFEDAGCWLCSGRDANFLSAIDRRLTIDHIAGRNSKNCHARTNLGLYCWRCHRDRIPSMSMQEKVLLKIKHDPQGFDEVKFLEIRRAKNGRIDF